MVERKVKITLQPPTSAASHDPFEIDSTATLKADEKLEQAVSILKDGPCNPKQYDSRFG
jgi:hypothetical protein